MSQRQARISWGLLAAVCLGICLTLSIARGQNQKSRPAEEFLPKNTVLFAGQDGAAKHKRAWENTAAHEAMYDSGMVAVLEKIVEFITQQVGDAGDPQFEEAMKHLEDHGLSLAISIPNPPSPPLPQVTLVFHDAAKYEPLLNNAINNLSLIVGVQFEERDVKSRTVTSAVIPNTPGIEVGFWAEGGHLIVVAGMNAVNNGIAVADSDAPNITSNDIWKKYRHSKADFEATTVTWLDFATIRNKFGQMPLPIPTQQPRTINDVLKVWGFHNVGTVAYQYGYKGRSLWSETTVEVDGRRTGLLSLADQKPMTLQDLPPLPAATSGFHAVRFDQSKFYETATKMVRDAAAFAPPEVAAQVEGVLSNLPQIIGFDPATDLFDPLGDVICMFADPDQGFLGTGMGVAIKVDDAEKLSQTIDRLLEMASQAAGDVFGIRRVKKHGREIILFEFNQEAQIGALAIDDDWLIFGLLPQSVEAFLLRLDGKLPAWKPTELQAKAFSEVPREFTSISMGDPRVAWRALIKLAPAALIGGQVALKESGLVPRDMVLPITLADIPPAELVVKPLYPNVTVQTVDDEGIHTTTRQSLPGIPLISGIGDGQGIVTVAILTALILPAIQQAREAARRTQSRNNLKMMGIGLHNYHDVNGRLPQGTHPNEKLKPNKRISWVASFLPYLDEQALSDAIDFDESWDDKANEMAASKQVRLLLHPSNPRTRDGDGNGVTHYVGIAGLGKDAAKLPVTNKRAGMFGFDRKTTFRDVTDGNSNTLMISEASKDFGPWISGGNATLRSLTKKPYINGPDGIGGPSPGGCQVLFGDGRVRFISEHIDPELFEGMSTIAGGEIIGAF